MTTNSAVLKLTTANRVNMSNEGDHSHLQNPNRSNAICVQGRKLQPSSEFQTSTMFGSPTSVDLFSLHSISSWQRITFSLIHCGGTLESSESLRNDHVSHSHQTVLCEIQVSSKREDLLETLPEDLILQILDFVDVQSAVGVFGASCRRCRNLIRLEYSIR